MPKFLKNDTITLLEAGAEAFLLGLYGLAMPSQRHLHKKETKYAPIIGLFGSAFFTENQTGKADYKGHGRNNQRARKRHDKIVLRNRKPNR